MDIITGILFLILFIIIITIIVLYFTGIIPHGTVGPIGPTGPAGIPGSATNTGATGPTGINNLPDYAHVSLTHKQTDGIIILDGPISFNHSLVHGSVQFMNGTTLLVNPGTYQISFGYNNETTLPDGPGYPASISLIINSQNSDYQTLQSNLYPSTGIPVSTPGQSATVIFEFTLPTTLQLQNTTGRDAYFRAPFNQNGLGSIIAYMTVVKIF